MKITAISPQQKDIDRVNVFIDGAYSFSLDVSQIIELKIKVGQECTEADLVIFEQESQFGKVYCRSIEYCLMRLHSAREVRNYLYKKTRSSRTKTGELKPGISPDVTNRVFKRLVDKGYVDDVKFTKYWVENRSLNKGVSVRKLMAELRLKGVDESIINQALSITERNDNDEMQKIIIKKRSHYPDNQKFASYLLRLGFNYDDIKRALSVSED